eukprot:176506-Rhodomonas_salina.1
MRADRVLVLVRRRLMRWQVRYEEEALGLCAQQHAPGAQVSPSSASLHPRDCKTTAQERGVRGAG